MFMCNIELSSIIIFFNITDGHVLGTTLIIIWQCYIVGCVSAIKYDEIRVLQKIEIKKFFFL